MEEEITRLRARIATLEASFQKVQDKQIALYAIQEVARSLTHELNLDPLLRKVLAVAVKVMKASAGSLLLWDKTTDELEFAVIEGGGGDKLKGLRIARDTGIAGWVATHREPLIVDDVNKDDRYDQTVAQTFDLPVSSLLCVPMISHNNLIGVLQVLCTEPNRRFNELDRELLTTFASQAAIALENARLYESLKEERDRLVVVEDDIRKRLSRDLHDGPVQLIASVVMSLTFSQDLVKRAPEHLPQEIAISAQVAEKALKQLRTLLFNLRPVILETQGLIPALELYTERMMEDSEFDLVLTVEQRFQRLLPRAENAIFAIVQEALNNAKKYARPSRIDLILRVDHEEDTLTVLIRDDGQGFNIEAMKAGYDKQGSLGMLNMQERAETMDGTFTIDSVVGKGTEVILKLPLTKNLL